MLLKRLKRYQRGLHITLEGEALIRVWKVVYKCALGPTGGRIRTQEELVGGLQT